MHLFKGTVLLLVALAAVPSFAANADLVTVSTHTSTAASRGGGNHGDILITNITTTDVRVALTAWVVYSDGTVQSLSGLGDPGVVPPDGGVALSITFVIPPDAALGTANFVAEVKASASGGRQETETSSATFIVFP